jgi:RNA polymerase sigma factor (sigma-70 family)
LVEPKYIWVSPSEIRRFVDPTSDNRLMEEIKDGRVERLAILFERYHIMLFNFFLRLTGNRSISEDLVQDVFFRILKYRKTYLGQSKFSVWMYQIARNVHVDFLRKRKLEVPLDDQFEEPASSETPLVERLSAELDASLLKKALDRLPLRKKEVLLLSRFQELKYREIAELLGCDIGSIKSTVHRAIKDLGRIYLELQGGESP